MFLNQIFRIIRLGERVNENLGFKLDFEHKQFWTMAISFHHHIIIMVDNLLLKN